MKQKEQVQQLRVVTQEEVFQLILVHIFHLGEGDKKGPSSRAEIYKCRDHKHREHHSLDECFTKSL